ncbi:pyridoxal-phosphate dependent enzyme [Pseudomonas sp. SA3-5]|uniref:cysteine synthase n=1 Tax=Pseudomonas aestuarii TaxID=3018340 RepID=A0ABT4XH94_9PSED|nr:pyridoxal-phosphate dependent enzyme [Pseudomonas aestuarii]MDA7087591.1 pyridoxal-phosphate dependent enzyme [Pseudomonas aestuarii]
MNIRYESILATIGRTPVIRINRLAPAGIELYVKAEAFNPMGSVKDRMALSVIEAAEASGALQPGQTVIEATSGNTGIGLAMVCAAKGYPLVVTMAENFSIERRKILRFLGARVVLTPAALKGSGMVGKAEELAAAHGWFLVRQFENEANADAHTRTTALEILDAFADGQLDYFVTGYGTGGTLKGTARVLREYRPTTRIVVCEPDNSPLLGSGIEQMHDAEGRPLNSHPAFRPHLMQGWTPDFIPKLTDDARRLGLIDRIMPVNGNQALHYARQLARQEGIFCGPSSGATFAGAMAVAAEAAPGSRILCMLPDTGERYLSTPLFEDIAVDMTAEEQDLASSTPNFRFDVAVSAPGAGPSAPVEPAADAETEALLAQILADPQRPLVMFALEWCEFCWSARKLFHALGVAYRSIDLDSVEYQQGDLGGRLRVALRHKSGMLTIPQVFIGGELVGGCNELFGAYADGRLATMLRAHGVDLAEAPTIDPATLAPAWLHPRS